MTHTCAHIQKKQPSETESNHTRVEEESELRQLASNKPVSIHKSKIWMGEKSRFPEEKNPKKQAQRFKNKELNIHHHQQVWCQLWDSQEDDLRVDVWSEGERRGDVLAVAPVQRGGLAILLQLLRPCGESLDVHEPGTSAQRIHPPRHCRATLDAQAKRQKSALNLYFNTAGGALKTNVED